MTQAQSSAPQSTTNPSTSDHSTTSSTLTQCNSKWYWSPSTNTFTPYDDKHNNLIESHYHKYTISPDTTSPILPLQIGEFIYNIDVQKFRQINTNSQKSRRLRRITSSWRIAGAQVTDALLLKQLNDAYHDTSITSVTLEYNSNKYEFYIDDMIMYPKMDDVAQEVPESSQSSTLPDLDVERDEDILPEDDPEGVAVLKMTDDMMDSPQSALPKDATPDELKTLIKDITGYVTLNKQECEQLTEDCPICLYDMNSNDEHEVVQICGRDHFHLDCLVECFDKLNCFLRCPLCLKSYGIRRGTMPRGTMTIQTHPELRCAGYNCGTVVINYHFPNGVQRAEHPHPGEHYAGTSRTAYLPDNSEGRYILKMFKIAWERRLLFTVGRSVTTGEDNSVIWNGVHHKTSTHGGFSNFAYPDDTYFARVQGELNDKGVSLPYEIEYDLSTRTEEVNEEDGEDY